MKWSETIEFRSSKTCVWRRATTPNYLGVKNGQFRVRRGEGFCCLPPIKLNEVWRWYIPSKRHHFGRVSVRRSRSWFRNFCQYSQHHSYMCKTLDHCWYRLRHSCMGGVWCKNLDLHSRQDRKFEDCTIIFSLYYERDYCFCRAILFFIYLDYTLNLPILPCRCIPMVDYMSLDRNPDRLCIEYNCYPASQVDIWIKEKGST